MYIQKTDLFKTTALLLCVLFLCMYIVPLVHSLEKCWGRWKCWGVRIAYWASIAALVAICDTPTPAIAGCLAAFATYFFFQDLYTYKCKKCKR